jgi:hypothetical protein
MHPTNTTSLSRSRNGTALTLERQVNLSGYDSSLIKTVKANLSAQDKTSNASAVRFSSPPLLLVNPSFLGALPGDNLLLVEPQGNLLLSAINAV